MIITDEILLRRPCGNASIDEVGDIVLSLEKALEESSQAGMPGIGLAAPQIGILKNVAIIRIPTPSGLYSVNLVNCNILSGFDKQYFENEGCLSFPGRVERTLRYREVYVVNNLVSPHSFTAKGIAAVCIQHELDHLNGILLPDVAVISI